MKTPGPFDSLTATTKAQLRALYLHAAERLFLTENHLVCSAILLAAQGGPIPVSCDYERRNLALRPVWETYGRPGLRARTGGYVPLIWSSDWEAGREPRILALLLLREMLRTERRPRSVKRKRRLS